MMILVFDTETTGLPIKDEYGKNPSIYKHKSWPYVLQLSFAMYDSEKNLLLSAHDYIIKLKKNVEISQESINVHNITRKISEKNGTNIKPILKLFNECLLEADVIVAHNIRFDMQMIMVEGIRNGIQMKFAESDTKKMREKYCTMKNGIDLCKIVKVNKFGGEYFKFPKLIELHNTLFGNEPRNLHNAFYDILICLRCYCKIELNKDITRINREVRSWMRETY